jgi:beta-lactamase superfamily II metal-dependent hydrolase
LPGNDALDVYRSLSVPLLRTDKDGLIQVCSDGRGVTCRVFRKGE